MRLAEHAFVAVGHVLSNLSGKISILLAIRLFEHLLHDALAGVSHAAMLSKQSRPDRIVRPGSFRRWCASIEVDFSE